MTPNANASPADILQTMITIATQADNRLRIGAFAT